MTTPAQLHDATSARCFRISADDTVRLAVVRAPDDVDPSSVSFEIWDPGGAQPPNSHPRSVETFFFLRGAGVAISDGVEHPVRAGQLLVLPPGSVHRIVNTGTGRLYAITTMTPDDGFVDLITGGVPDALDEEDLDVLRVGW
ncbi:MAG: cupin domain-containing protein [Ilumatobacteraceae bacterium]